MHYIRTDTAVTIQLGPFVDATDGVTAETGLTISQADVRLSKAGAAFAQKNEASAGTHDENGWYRVPLDTTDTNTVGRLIVAVHVSGALPVWREFWVTTANVHNSLTGADKLQVDVTQIDGSNTPADILADAVWDELLSGHTDNGSAGEALANTVTLGAGAITFTYTLTSSVDASPIADATVWVTTDQGGTHIVASGTTNSSGQVVFYLDAGTYYVWREKAGWTFTNPDTETVS